VLKKFLDVFIKLFQGEADFSFCFLDHDPGEMLGDLDIHVFIKIEPGQLGPERDIKSQGQLKSPVGIGMGHYAHGSCQAVTFQFHIFPPLTK
jgi:hypothetical protein